MRLHRVRLRGGQGLNLRPLVLETNALPAELPPLGKKKAASETSRSGLIAVQYQGVRDQGHDWVESCPRRDWEGCGDGLNDVFTMLPFDLVGCS